MPEINTTAIHVPTISIDCPTSGWLINNIIIEDSIKKLKKYDVFEILSLLDVKILAVKRIKKGLINSIGCSLKKYRLNQRLDPFTSTPIKGTRARVIKKIINNGITAFFKTSCSIKERKNIIKNEAMTKIKCFEKKK